jgi:hypothetical protein
MAEPLGSSDGTVVAVAGDRQQRRDSIYWARRLLVCNPFYLVSAALLLYGLYLVSIDSNFPGRELAQFWVNFGSMHFYELLLVLTAILLASRRVWYDSVLLINLENLFILVPFILVSQAVLIDRRMFWATCLASGVMALLRFGTLKRFYKQLNLPRGLLVCGAAVLLVNIALPLIYRTLHETKVGTKPTEGAAFEMNHLARFVILPGLIALANALPRPAESGDLLLPKRRWVPTSLFSLWLVGSTAHFYCLGYIYNFDWEPSFAAPALWLLAWTICNRHRDFLPLPIPALSNALLFLPAATTLIPVVYTAPGMFLILTTFNILIFGLLLLRERRNRVLLNLLVISFAALALGLVESFERALPPSFSVDHCALCFVAAYAAWWILISRNPKLGVLGGMIVGISVGGILDGHEAGMSLGVQAGLLFLLLHSLLWNDAAHHGARGARIFGCILWLGHSLLLVLSQRPYAGATLFIDAGLVLAACAVFKIVTGKLPPVVLTATALIVLLMHPGGAVAVKAQYAPAGPAVILGSFLLFAVGTVLALTKSRWHPQRGVALASAPVNPPTK